MEIRDSDPFASETAPRDDPFARARPVAEDEVDASTPEVARTVTLMGPLANRDPRGAMDDSAEFHITGAVSFDDVLRSARRRGFLAGCAAGAIAASIVALALASGSSSPAAVTPTPPRPQRAEAPEPAALALRETGAPSPAVHAAPARTPTTARPRSAPAPGAAAPGSRGEVFATEARGGGDVLTVSALDLRLPPEEAAPAPEPRTPPAQRPADGAAPVREARPEPGPAGREAAPRRTLEDGEVAAALALRRDAIDACVAATATGLTAAAGRRYLLVLAIDPSGRVSDARIDDPSIGATPLGTCLVRIAREMSFEPFDGEPVRVELPLRHAAAE